MDRVHRCQELWQDGRAPNANGLYSVRGQSHFADIGGPALPHLRIGPRLSEAYLRDATRDGMKVFVGGEATLKSGDGWIICGSGVFGADGFVARLDGNRRLVWILALTDSNPFDEVSITLSRATVVNDLGYSLTIDLQRPVFGP